MKILGKSAMSEPAQKGDRLVSVCPKCARDERIPDYSRALQRMAIK
jgi:hypothetical protein